MIPNNNNTSSTVHGPPPLTSRGPSPSYSSIVDDNQMTTATSSSSSSSSHPSVVAHHRIRHPSPPAIDVGIHNLGRGKLGRINARYPPAKNVPPKISSRVQHRIANDEDDHDEGGVNRALEDDDNDDDDGGIVDGGGGGRTGGGDFRSLLAKFGGGRVVVSSVGAADDTRDKTRLSPTDAFDAGANDAGDDVRGSGIIDEYSKCDGRGGTVDGERAGHSIIPTTVADDGGGGGEDIICAATTAASVGENVHTGGGGGGGGGIDIGGGARRSIGSSRIKGSIEDESDKNGDGGGGGGSAFDAIRSKFGGNVRKDGNGGYDNSTHAKSSSIFGPPPQPRTSNVPFSSSSSSTSRRVTSCRNDVAAVGIVATDNDVDDAVIIADADEGGGESSAAPAPAVVVAAAPIATTSPPLASGGRARVTIPSFLKSARTRPLDASSSSSTPPSSPPNDVTGVATKNDDAIIVARRRVDDDATSAPPDSSVPTPPRAYGNVKSTMPSFLKSARTGPIRQPSSPRDDAKATEYDDAAIVAVDEMAYPAPSATMRPSTGKDESTSTSSPRAASSNVTRHPWSKSKNGIVNDTVRSLTSENSSGVPLPVEKRHPSESETKHPPTQSRARAYQRSISQTHSPSMFQSSSKAPGRAPRPPKLRIDPNDANVVPIHVAAASSKRNMVMPKSHQRLVLERVAAQYFLRDTRRDARYVGASDYGTWDNDGMGFIDENFVRTESSASARHWSNITANKDGEAVLSFLGGAIHSSGVDDEQRGGPNEEGASNSGVIAEAISSTRDNGNLGSAEQSARDVVGETDIDCILEIASDHLSLGKNDLALQAYRRAMTVAFADVVSVKNKIVEVKRRQENLDPSAADLTREEEQHFELSLLKVASRVADVHNNMGVVHEMNRHYEKARSSYMDALEVYHNTCKRFEEKGDPDVDRTKKNIERMTLACDSEHQRKALHERATCIAKKLEGKIHPNVRKNLLSEVVATLRTALALESETIGLTHPVSAGTLIQIGKYHYEMREFDSAVLEIRQAITILRNALGDNHPQVGKSTLLLASIYERHWLNVSPQGTRKDDSELELYVDALGPLKAALGEVHTEIGFLYSKIGYLYGKKGDLSLSLLAYKASLKAYGEPCLNEINLEVMSIWVRITEYLTSLKLWDEVLVAGRRALYLLRRSRNTLFASGSAVASGGASPRIPVTTTKRSQIRITSDTYSSSLFATLQSLGQAHTSRSDYSLARDACSESLQLGWDMALSASKDNADNEALTGSVTRVVKALKRLGKAYLLEKHYAPALECFLPSLELLRSNKETESTLDCASVLGSLGFLHLKLKKYAESSNFLRECLRLYHKNGVDSNDRETRKIEAWLDMAESREGDVEATLPFYLEIPTIVFQDEIIKFG